MQWRAGHRVTKGIPGAGEPRLLDSLTIGQVREGQPPPALLRFTRDVLGVPVPEALAVEHAAPA